MFLQGEAEEWKRGKYTKRQLDQGSLALSFGHLCICFQFINSIYCTFTQCKVQYCSRAFFKNKRSFNFNYQIDHSTCSSRQWPPQAGMAGRHDGQQEAAEPGWSHGPELLGELLQKGGSSGPQRLRACPGPGMGPAGLS